MNRGERGDKATLTPAEIIELRRIRNRVGGLTRVARTIVKCDPTGLANLLEGGAAGVAFVERVRVAMAAETARAKSATCPTCGAVRGGGP